MIREHYVRNSRELSRTPERALALTILEAGLASIATETIIQRSVVLTKEGITFSGCDGKQLRVEHASIGMIYVVAIGKCSIDASVALERILGDRIHRGIAVDVRSASEPLKHMQVYEGTHPYPSAKNVEYSEHILEMLKEVKENDLVIFVISGGASTLLCHPENHTCEDEREVVEELFKAGATIDELNTVRKHLSIARGGNLAKAVYKTPSVSLIFSDAAGDDISQIASGPTLLDTSSVQDAKDILTKYCLEKTCDVALKNLQETPKDPTLFEKAEHFLVASNTILLKEMAKKATEMGYTSEICTSCLCGEAKDLGKEIAEKLHNVKKRHVMLYGGEPTVTIRGMGRGGRNQELALSALLYIKDSETILSCATDGKDNSTVAGAIADTLSRNDAKEKQIDVVAALKNNDSHTAWRSIGSYIDTGYTGINVADVVLAIAS